MLKLNDLEIAPNSDGRPVYPPSIRSVEVVVNPFDDVVPRVTPEERKRQKEARKEAKADKEKQKLKLKHQKLAKCVFLSFLSDLPCPQIPIVSCDQEQRPALLRRRCRS